MVDELVPMVDRWAGGKVSVARLFHAPQGGPLSEGNWKRSVRWSAVIKAIGVATLRVHDLRHTAASVWLGSGADPKVVQRISGHASAAMTMDLYGHLIDQTSGMLPGRSGTPRGHGGRLRVERRNPQPRKLPSDLWVWWSRLSESNRRPSHTTHAAGVYSSSSFKAGSAAIGRIVLLDPHPSILLLARLLAGSQCRSSSRHMPHLVPGSPREGRKVRRLQPTMAVATPVCCST
ncbi:tyrosine-type recombinase/integrase [Kribbella sp. NPDC051952]|uniref:tyrosine-type recombinase/integrase n=1 Tax=Kribbella sp. NPDC051952 TaxID=3154851 RepID=UPI0034371918